MSHGGKLGLERVDAGRPYSRKHSRPRVNHAKSAIKMNNTILQSDLHLNPDPLVRLIGEPNEAAQKYIDKETTWYKTYYDKNFRCAILRNGDLVLVRINKFGTDHKIADKWEQDPWEVLSQRDDSPLLTIRNVTTNEIRELHRNMLFLLRLVDPEGPQEDNTTMQIKANRLRVTLFACDCGNCAETV